MSEKGGGEFLHAKYPDLQKSDQVQRSVNKNKRIDKIATPNNPSDRDEVFLKRLEHIFDNPNEETKQRNIELFKNNFLYPSVLIDPNNVPKSYFDLQKKIAKERNETDLLDTSQEAKKRVGEIIYKDQKESLDVWIDYLSDKQTDYPIWFNYFTLRSVLKMGSYDKEKQEFSNRSKNNTNSFAELNQEALAFVHNALEEHYLKHEKHSIKELNTILESANFAKIYAYAIDKVTPASKENKEKTEGEWTKFNKGDDPTAIYESLQGHGTGWCTAGGKETARTQLQGGDFYVYYSEDENGKNTMPRIAIRMENGEVAEVRGVEAGQNLESNMTDIAQEKYHQLPGGEKFDKKDHDMKLLTLIDNKVNDNQELNKEELKFLYEIDEKIEGFGYQEDPRIEEIKSKRNIKSDVSILYNYSLDQIADSSKQITEDTKVCLGNLDISDIDMMNNCRNSLVVFGDADFENCTALTFIPENITFNGKADFRGCKSLTSISENIAFNGKAYFNNCTALTSISENIAFNGEANFYGCKSLISILENITFNGDVNFKNCTALTSIPENIIFNGNANFYDCKSLTSIPENITFKRNVDFRGCTALTSIPENITFKRNVDFRGCTFKLIEQLRRMQKEGKIKYLIL